MRFAAALVLILPAAFSGCVITKPGHDAGTGGNDVPDAATATDGGKSHPGAGMDASSLQDGSAHVGGRDAGHVPGDSGAVDAGSDAGVNTCLGKTDGTSCGADGTCCNQSCVDLKRDVTHCGSCALDCSGVGFCSEALACEPARLDKVCENGSLIMIRDGLTSDNTAGNAMTSAIAKRCSQTVKKVSDSDQTVTGPDNRLVVGAGTTVVIGGGPAVQRAEGHLEISLSPVYFDNYTLKLRRDGPSAQPVAASPVNCEVVSSDHFVLQTIVAESGALVISGYGFCPQGTVAMSVYFEQQIVPNIDTLTQTWWIVRWNDLNGDNTPDANDQFTLVLSGP